MTLSNRPEPHPSVEEAAPPLSMRGPVIRFLIALLFTAPFVASYVNEALGRDPRSLVLLLLLTPPLVYTALAVGRRWSGAPMTSRWRALFALLAIAAALPSMQVVESLAQTRERRIIELLLQPVQAEIRARQAGSGRPPLDMEDILRKRLRDVPNEAWRQRNLTYRFDESRWALQIDCVSMDRDDDATLTLTSDGRALRHDTGSDGGQERSQRLLEAEVPFLTQARTCACRNPRGDVDTLWQCTPPCGTWTGEGLTSSPTVPPPSPEAARPSPASNGKPGGGSGPTPRPRP